MMLADYGQGRADFKFWVMMLVAGWFIRFHDSSVCGTQPNGTWIKERQNSVTHSSKGEQATNLEHTHRGFFLSRDRKAASRNHKGQHRCDKWNGVS